MRLKEARHEAGVNNFTAVAHIKTIEPRFTKPILSFVENGIVLPVPAIFREMCKLYGKRPEEMLSRKDVDFGLPNKKDGHKLKRKLTVRLTDEAREVLRPEVFQACGYLNQSDWLYACIRRLKAQYEIKEKVKTRRVG